MLEGRGDYKMKFNFKKCFSFKSISSQNYNDIDVDTPEKRSLAHTILD